MTLRGDRPLTLMAVHAHPDDEASSTGGILAKYASEGIETVLVVCTNGELGDGPGGSKPGADNHVESVVVATRRAELQRSCEQLAIKHVELLGYHDSGMMGWPQNEDPHAFWQVPVDQAARALGALVEHYRPQVVVTYDEHGFYGHPDHIQAHRITVAALGQTDVVDKLYCPAIPKSALTKMGQMMKEAGLEVGEGDFDFGTEDDQITSTIDCSAFVSTKRDALGAHASQSDSTFFLNFPRPIFDQMFSFEHFVRLLDRTHAAVPETDLFAGLR